jgi:crossover junction endodeoxyribonuclease RuvC
VIYIGIDPGLDGALAAITPNGLEVYDTPTYRSEKGKRRYSTAMMSRILGGLRERGAATAMIEAVHAMPGQGVTSMFSMGYGLGLWHALLVGHEILWDAVSPQRWKKVFDLDRDKDKSRVLAQSLFPGEFFKRKKDHGRAEAALIAEYGRRVRG